MTPVEFYNQDLKRADFVHDSTQEQVVLELQRLYQDLTHTDVSQAGWDFKPVYQASRLSSC